MKSKITEDGDFTLRLKTRGDQFSPEASKPTRAPRQPDTRTRANTLGDPEWVQSRPASCRLGSRPNLSPRVSRPAYAMSRCRRPPEVTGPLDSALLTSWSRGPPAVKRPDLGRPDREAPRLGDHAAGPPARPSYRRGGQTLTSGRSNSEASPTRGPDPRRARHSCDPEQSSNWGDRDPGQPPCQIK